MKQLISFLKRMKDVFIGEGKELDPNCQMGLGIVIADDILEYLGHGDLGSNIDSIRFYADDPKIVEFLEERHSRSILAERIRRERIPERVKLADGIERGWISICPLGEAPENNERINRVKNLDAVVKYEVFRKTSKADCKISIEGMTPFHLSETEDICGQYPFGRKSPHPLRDNSFMLPDNWSNASRTQGAIFKKHGIWSIIQQVDRPKMKVNGKTLEPDSTAELIWKGKIEIEGHKIIYEIVEQ